MESSLTTDARRSKVENIKQDARHASSADAAGWWDFCPNCGERLHNQGCKYRCARCHYFMSCSDFDQ